MTERIARLTEMTLSGSMYPEINSVDFDRSDYFLCERKRNVKRLCEFIRAQNPKLTEYQSRPIPKGPAASRTALMTSTGLMETPLNDTGSYDQHGKHHS